MSLSSKNLFPKEKNAHLGAACAAWFRRMWPRVSLQWEHSVNSEDTGKEYSWV